MTQTDVAARLAALARGEPAAFAALYDSLADRMYSVARALTGSRTDAEDAVQEALLALVRSRRSLAGARDLDAYVFAVLRRAAARRTVRARRDAAGALDAGDEPAAGGPSPAEAAEDASARDARIAALERARAALPAPQREVLTLKIDGELTFDEIACVLGISANTAASRYRYALEKLRRSLAAGGRTE